MKVVLYCRVSTEKEAQISSLKRQRAELTAMAENHGLEIVDCIEEQASGYEIEREGIFFCFGVPFFKTGGCIADSG
ncbi:site-specific recombinase, resolvase family protein [Halobacillus sp. BAB-2008]|nr:site-specific recombinase, resolvase family protein [Halobacillus sp. BAB-2008]